MTKGKGKGKKGKGKGKGGGEGKAEFNGACNHCGIWGHRRSECRKLDTELAQKGPSKGGKGGPKGGPKGGKGPLMECADDGDWAGDGAELDLDETDFFFDNAIGSITAAAFTPATPPVATPVFTPAVNTYVGPKSANPKVGTKSATPAVTPVVTLAAKVTTATGQKRQQRKYNSYAGAPPMGACPFTTQGKRTVTTHNRFAALNTLTEADAPTPGALCAVAGDTRGSRTIEVAVDSGAVHSVTPPNLFPAKVTPGLWSREGRCYRAANGTLIKNLGETRVPFSTTEGHRCRLDFQVADVTEPLLSVTHLTSAGNRVEFGATSGRIVNIKTGRSIALHRRGTGLYFMTMIVADTVGPAPFRRQGA